MSVVQLKTLCLLVVTFVVVGCNSDGKKGGAKGFGETCMDGSECSSALCADAPLNYCVQTCDDQTPCPATGTCSPTGYCILTDNPNAGGMMNGGAMTAGSVAGGSAASGGGARGGHMAGGAPEPNPVGGQPSGGMASTGGMSTMPNTGGMDNVGGMSAPMGDPDVAACQRLNSCVNDCMGDMACQQACQNASTPEAQQRYNAIFQCIQANNCANQLTNQIDQMCLDDNCAMELERCFGPRVVPMGTRTCRQLLICYNGCVPADVDPVENQACRSNCLVQSAPQSAALYDALVMCMQENCQAEMFSLECQNTRCADSSQACLEDGLTFGDEACGSILECVFDCPSGRCQSMCLDRSDREGRRLMEDVLACARQNRCASLDECSQDGVCNAEIGLCRADEPPMQNAGGAPAGGQAAGGAVAGGQAAGGVVAGGQAAGGALAGSQAAGGAAAGGQPVGGQAAGGAAAGGDVAGGAAAGGAAAGGQPAPQFDPAQTYSCALNPSVDRPYYCVEASGALCNQSPQACRCEGDAANPVEMGNSCQVGCAFKCELFAGALTTYFYNYATIDEIGLLAMTCNLQGGNVVACD